MRLEDAQRQQDL